jgi:alpha-mannosidase
MNDRITAHCIGNAHIDPVWRWRWQEGYTETLSTCRAALDRLDESDDFVFSRGQAATYAWIEEADPGMFEEIRRYVREGRWRIINGWWEQPDCNVPAGESYVRHALYGKRYFRQKLGVEVTAGWNPDTFGHNGGLPQILAKSGFKTYTFFRPGKREKELPGPYFWWQGPDGSRVLGIRPPVGHYGTGGGSMAETIRESAEAARELGLNSTIVCYGVGNHGGGPTRKNIESIRALHEDPAEPDAIFSSIDAFADSVSDKADTFPVVKEDLQHHAPGCYTTHSGVKRLNRKAENALIRAERWLSLVGLALDRPVETAQFAHAWKLVLFNQFHDILAGSSMSEAYRDGEEQIGEAIAIASRLENEALQVLAATIDTSIDETDPPAAAHGRPAVVFNPSSWERTDIVSVQWSWNGKTKARLVDDAGDDVPFQFAQPTIFGGGMRILFEATVPANGFRVYRLLTPEDHDEEGEPPQVAETQPEDPDAPTAGNSWLQNRYWRLEIDPKDGHVSRLIDRATGLDVVSGPACALLVMDDPGDTWGHDIASWRDEVGRFVDAKLRIVDQGPACVTMAVDTSWQKSTARQEFTLYRDTPRIDVRLTLDWREHYRMLKLSVPAAVHDGVLTYEAPYSAITREANGLEDPGQTWIDLSGTLEGAPYGLSLLNDCKFGFDCLGSDMRMSIVRSPIYCFHDPTKPEAGKEYEFMDQGCQIVHYSLLPHSGDWREGGTVRQAQALNNPLQSLFQYAHRGARGRSGSLLTVSPANVVVAVLKGAEDGDDLIVRLLETEGAASDAALSLPEGRTHTVKMGPWELKTLRLSRTGGLREVNLLEE